MVLSAYTQQLYKILLQKLHAIGNVTVEEKKTSIHIKNKAAFAGVHPRKDYFILNIVSADPLKSERIFKQEQVSKSRYHNELRIEKEEDINDQLLAWLGDAYRLMG